MQFRLYLYDAGASMLDILVVGDFPAIEGQHRSMKFRTLCGVYFPIQSYELQCDICLLPLDDKIRKNAKKKYFNLLVSTGNKPLKPRIVRQFATVF